MITDNIQSFTTHLSLFLSRSSALPWNEHLCCERQLWRLLLRRSWRSWWRRTCTRWRWTAPICWSTSTEWVGWRTWPWCGWTGTWRCTARRPAWFELWAVEPAAEAPCPGWSSSSSLDGVFEARKQKQNNKKKKKVIYHRADGRWIQVCTQ